MVIVAEKPGHPVGLRHQDRRVAVPAAKVGDGRAEPQLRLGKTRLLDEFAVRAAAEGARVALGTCIEGLCPPFAPLREIFSGLDLPSPFENGDEPSPSGAASEAQRYRVFLAAAAALASMEVRTSCCSTTFIGRTLRRWSFWLFSPASKTQRCSRLGPCAPTISSATTAARGAQ
ncbi:MAG: hypothetical protein WAJ94_07710 [Candidatus Cybelea sp.]